MLTHLHTAQITVYTKDQKTKNQKSKKPRSKKNKKPHQTVGLTLSDSGVIILYVYIYIYIHIYIHTHQENAMHTLVRTLTTNHDTHKRPKSKKTKKPYQKPSLSLPDVIVLRTFPLCPSVVNVPPELLAVALPDQTPGRRAVLIVCVVSVLNVGLDLCMYVCMYVGVIYW